jgi:hypothetical protein
MFSDKASRKLAEIFDTLFKSEDPRGDKLEERIGGPTITSVVPNTVRVGEAAELSITGERLANVTSVRLDDVEREPDTVTDKQVKVKLTADDVKAGGAIKVAVVSSDGAVSSIATMHVTDLEITSASPLTATAAADVNQTLTASAGTTPYTWSLANAPAWLKIDAKTGALTSKPPAAGVVKDVSVTVTDKDGASVSKKFDLNVT